MDTSDSMDFSTFNSSYDYYWPRCTVENFTMYSASIMKILGLPSFQLAFTISKVLIIACFCTTFIVGILGNGLVIWIAGFKMKTVSAVWFVNLAIVDFLFCISLPCRVTLWFLSHNLRYLLQLINLIALYLNSIISVLFLTVISIDRCVAIMWPIWAKVHRTRRLANICSVFIWTVPIFVTMACIYILTIDIHTFYISVPMYDDLSDYCEIEYSSVEKYLMVFRSFIMFGLSFSIIIVCYSLIIYRLQFNAIKRPRRFQRTFRIIIAVVSCFFVCWFPYNVWPFVAKNKTMHDVLTDFIISSLCLCLVSISSCLNPILYVLLGKGRGSNWRKSIKSRLESTMMELK
ncbi:C3a anaphylatoxin chemotactic receptor-like [Rana temporaria]|uniref:C3a anaphylatoxin chemotactic receptor-like n=1 Tax=Rana temporaria TaxID=8407 RepID=UPI001AAD47EC|nr:C3a anaphylatoxin chemotactic receptor-like [Rana temporaria]